MLDRFSFCQLTHLVSRRYQLFNHFIRGVKSVFFSFFNPSILSIPILLLFRCGSCYIEARGSHRLIYEKKVLKLFFLFKKKCFFVWLTLIRRNFCISFNSDACCLVLSLFLWATFNISPSSTSLRRNKFLTDLSSPQAVLIVHGKAVDNNGNGKGQDENSREGAKTANLDFFPS